MTYATLTVTASQVRAGDRVKMGRDDFRRVERVLEGGGHVELTFVYADVPPGKQLFTLRASDRRVSIAREVAR